MRLRRKPWIDEAIKEYGAFVHMEGLDSHRGAWQDVFPANRPLHVELGTGKGQFISQMAAVHPDINYLGIEVQLGVLYYAAKKTADLGLTNLHLLLFDIAGLQSIFAEGEVDRFYINFCDPWPKARHAKRRLTYRTFLDQYARLLKEDGKICFKTDNRELFDFSLEEFAERGWELSNVTYDLHQSGLEGNIMTEYEQKFSAKGQPICRCVASKPKEAQK